MPSQCKHIWVGVVSTWLGDAILININHCSIFNRLVSHEVSALGPITPLKRCEKFNKLSTCQIIVIHPDCGRRVWSAHFWVFLLVWTEMIRFAEHSFSPIARTSNNHYPKYIIPSFD